MTGARREARRRVRRRRLLMFAAAALAGSLASAPPSPRSVIPVASAHEPQPQPQAQRPTLASHTWNLVWSDEFDGRAGDLPEGSKWLFSIGGEPQWGNHEWEYYTARPENVALDGAGHLVITAQRERLPGMMPCAYGPCDVTSARISTKGMFAQAYGRFEARIRLPSGRGLWPTFWLMGSDIDAHHWPANGEIDVMEAVGSQPRTVFASIHGPGYANSGIGGAHTLPDGDSLSDAFHTFAVVWSPDRIDWSVDGLTYLTVARGDLRPGQRWVFDHPFYILLDLAVGGWRPGSPDGSTRFPASMVVDDVRVYAPAG